MAPTTLSAPETFVLRTIKCNVNRPKFVQLGAHQGFGNLIMLKTKPMSLLGSYVVVHSYGKWYVNFKLSNFEAAATALDLFCLLKVNDSTRKGNKTLYDLFLSCL